MNTTILPDYFMRIIPGLVLGGAMICLLRKRNVILRILIYIMIFIYIRDAMTPEALWSFGTEGFFWIRFIENPLVLILFGTLSAGFVFAIQTLDRRSASLIEWTGGSSFSCVLAGIAGMFIVVLPMLLLYSQVDISLRGGSVPLTLLPALCIVSLGANLLEEALFRGYFQGYLLKEGVGKINAAITSGVMFGFCHIFLASTVTSTGFPLLVFATYEGLVASFVRMRYGVIAATLTHGGAVFILSSGLV